MIISEEDAKEFGIKDGDTVEIYNDRSSILAGAVVSKNIMKGVVSVDEGAWYDPENVDDEKPRCQAGHANVLTPSIPTSTMAQSTSANTCLVAIKKVDVKPYDGIKLPILVEA